MAHRGGRPLERGSGKQRTASIADAWCSAAISGLVLLVCLVGSVADSGAAGPQQGTDTVDPHFKWKYFTGSPIYYSAPAIGPDGTIYVGSGAPSADPPLEALFALQADGTLKWQQTLGFYPVFTPAVGNGVVYVQDSSNSLYAMSAEDGSLLWKYPFSVYMEVGQAAPAIDSDGTVYVVDYAVSAISPGGVLNWRYYPQTPIAAALRSSPAIGPDGTIYVGVNGHYIDFSTEPRTEGPGLIALDRAGSLKWQYIFGGMDWVFSSPAIAGDGSIIIGTEAPGGVDTSYVYAVWDDGTLKWRHPVTGGRQIRSSPTVDVDGTIYIGVKANATGPVNAELLALNPDGSLKWSYGIDRSGADIYCTPTIGADGTIYFGAETGYLYALNPDGRLRWQFDTGAINWTSPTIAADGSLYIGSNSGSLYALQSDSPGLAASPWPKFRYDNANTGCLAGTACPGDCGGDGEVTVNEIITMVNIALGTADVGTCTAGDADGNGEITISELITAVNHALTGC
jgi:outer membrane protein assembly factor BamB